jgi:Helicase HerA, central domain
MNKDGYFYLGKEFSPEKDALTDQNFLYDASDLTTHGVVFGMTGSGKTGLCIDLLEEAIKKDIPMIIVDPKGDVSNLSLVFPDQEAADFREWVSPTQARQEGKDLDSYAADVAEKWKNGLASWGIGGDYIQDIKQKMDLRIFTPGSSAGMAVSIIQGFKAPTGDLAQDEEGLLEKIRNTVSALLSLLGINDDPLSSQPHILISNIIEHYWRLGRDLSIEELILNIQKPPFQRMGVFDVNQLIDEKERVALAFKINNIIASPSFRFWKTGMPLSAGNLFEKKDGKVPVNIFYIAHLNENERMFFLSLLLNEIVDWTRKQPGATDLKYLFYMDEIYGYLPPYPKNPPSKNPLMILMKQARAFGLGVVLVTQNPKDIDYKALTNTGTWFIGKLQAETDRERVMEGLRGILDASGDSLDSGELNTLMASLKKRVFLVKNVHEPGIKLFQTRWAISYLAGPLTRDQLKGMKKLSAPPLVSTQAGIAPPGVTPPAPSQVSPSMPTRSDLLPYPPQPDMSLEQLFESAVDSGNKVYSPYLYLQGEVVFDDNKLGIYVRNKYYSYVPLEATLDWQESEMKEEPEEYAFEPDSPVQGFEILPAKLNYTTLRRMQTSFKNHLYSQLVMKLFINRNLKLASQVKESSEEFRSRCREVVEKMIDKEIEKLKDKYERKIERLEDRIEREQLKVKKLKREVSSKRTEEVVSIGESVLGFLLGGKSVRGLSAAARRRRSSSSASSRLELGKTKLSQLEGDILELQEELEDKIADIEDKYYEKADAIEDFAVRLEKDDIIISRQTLLWKLT